MNKDKFFIYGGVPKAGSSWLYYMLAKHPEVEMPIIKEIRYFYLDQHFGKFTLWEKLFGKQWFLKNLRLRIYLRIKRKPSISLILKFIKYLCWDWTDNWYMSLFSKDKWSGDVSPQYCKLNDEHLIRIKNMCPNAKIIIGLRNPVDKEWSHIKMQHVAWRGKKTIEEVSEKEVITRIHNQEYTFINDYAYVIDKWRRFFDDEQILIYYYDELKANPQKLYYKICDFLSIERIKIEGIEKPQYKGIVEEIPEKYLKEIIKVNSKYIEDFAEKYPNEFSLKWLQSIKYDNLNK